MRSWVGRHRVRVTLGFGIVGLVGLLVVGAAACQQAVSVDPAPGSFYLRMVPPTAPGALTIRVDHDGEPSGWSAEFAAGDVVALDHSSLAEEYGLRVNDTTCEGRFQIQTVVETDLVLRLTDSGCRLEVIGSHPDDTVQHVPAPALDR